MDRRLLVFTLGMFAIGTDSFVVAGILPDISRSFDVDVASAGLLVTVYALTFAVMSPVVAAALAHWPRKHLLLSGLGVFVAGNILTAILPTFGLVLASRAVAGLGAAMFSPTATSTAVSLVAPDKRGSALAIVMAGLSGATALGTPIGTVIGSLGDWRATMWFVAALGVLAGAGIALRLSGAPLLPAVTLKQRLAPLGDARVALTLLTTFAVFAGLYVVYTYVSVSFDRATGGDGRVLGALLFLWGLAATAGNLGAGYLVDRFGNRRVINSAAIIAAIDFALMPWSSMHLSTSAVALVVWGACGWAMVVPQQHRLVSISPGAAPLLMALNSTALYIGVAFSGVVGGFGLHAFGRYNLGLVSAILIVAGLLCAELAYRAIRRRAAPVQQ